eukprot:SRR837773.26421.p1 GENE.SRR837773.26421~~SRR837773.26421.p1  ORF type:complete len:475 (+),score=123.42 SRR837773.26421:150-1427(+)
MVWLVCEMMLRKMHRVLLMEWPGIPWFLSAEQSHDDRCRNPATLMQYMKNQFIGWVPLFMDGAPTDEPLTCNPSTPRGELQAEIMGFMGRTLAEASAPFGPVAHLSGGADLSCLMALYLRHMLFNRSIPLDEVSSRTPEVYREYLDWAWPPFHGLAGHHYYDKIYNAKGDFVGQRKTVLEVIQITGDDFTDSPYIGGAPPWDVGPVAPNYEVKPDGSVVDGFKDNLIFEDGAACPEDHFPDCDVGEELVMGYCSKCAAGRYLSAEGACTPCMAGTYQSEPGQTQCIGCQLGRYSDTEGQSSCVKCESGSYRPSGTPATQCLPCGPGTFSSEEKQTANDGMEKCLPCPMSTYTNASASTACTPCPAGPGDERGARRERGAVRVQQRGLTGTAVRARDAQRASSATLARPCRVWSWTPVSGHRRRTP